MLPPVSARDQRVGDDRPAGSRSRSLSCALRGIVGDRAGIERRGIDVHARARPDHIGDDQPDDQRQRREEQEIAERLGRDPPDRARARACRRCPSTSVRKITGAMTILTSLMNPSPSGFSASPVAGQKCPSSAPSHDRDQHLDDRDATTRGRCVRQLGRPTALIPKLACPTPRVCGTAYAATGRSWPREAASHARRYFRSL